MQALSRSVMSSALPGVLALALAGAAAPAAAQGTTWSEAWVGSEWEMYVRGLAARGLVDAGPWSVRPLTEARVRDVAHRIGGSHAWAARMPQTDSLRRLEVLRPSLLSSYNSAFAWGAGDGAAWQGRGVNLQGTAGAALRWRFVSARLEPQLAYAANQAFELMPVEGEDPYGSEIRKFGIDLPQRFGDEAFRSVSAGRSHLRLAAGPVAATVTSEPIAWGPGMRHGLIFSATGTGFPHLTFGTSRPVTTRIGTFAANVIYASLDQTEWARPTEHPRRFGAGFIAVWMPFGQPIELGAARFYHKYWPEQFNADALLTPFGSAFYDEQYFGGGEADNQLGSIFTTVRVPSLGLELFGEYGRNDRSADLRDLAVEPEHNSAWLLGALHATTPDSVGGEFWTTRLEVVNARITRIRDLGRPQAIFYTHTPVYQGHTQRGQLLGTLLAEQSGGLELSVDRWARWGRAGVTLLERQLPGDREVGMIPGRERSQWDLGASMTWFRGGADVHGQLGHVWDLNRFPGRDDGNLYLRLGVTVAPTRSLGF